MRSKASPLVMNLYTLFLAGVISSCSYDSLPAKTLDQGGVPESMAVYRKKVMSGLSYQLSFHLPAYRKQPILAAESVRFVLKGGRQPLLLDFKESRTAIQQLAINGEPVSPVWESEHLLLPSRYLKMGHNLVEITFVAGNLSLNRNNDYLYTLLVPDRARTAFPCFDQPDLKAVFTLSLTMPQSWKAVANAPVRDSSLKNGEKTIFYQPSDTLPTYLFSFVAGHFEQAAKIMNGRYMNFLYRETDPSRLVASVDSVFDIHNKALTFLQDYTGVPFPFQKFDFVAIPDFQYGGMEHPGAILYKESTLFLDEGALLEQRIARANVIAHETAHMWFGDLVTMRWFNDVWMKEVFANFMADKIAQEIVPDSNFDLKFLTDHFPAAYSVDRTAGTHPVRQPLANLKDAGSLYGNIIYHKAPIVMRQLERLMGPEAFRRGLQEYLKKYAYGNASWPDLIQIMDRHTPLDLAAWDKVWVEEPGRPSFSYELKKKGGKIEKLLIRQTAEDGSGRWWPQLFEVGLVYADHMEQLPVNMNARQVVVRMAAGKKAPLFLLFNSSGMGYGLFPLDPNMQLRKVASNVGRASACINLLENMLSGRGATAEDLLQLYCSQLSTEQEELNLKLITGQIADLFWHYILPDERRTWAALLETSLWNAMESVPAGNRRKILFRTYQSIALTPSAEDRLYALWEKEVAPEGVRLSEDDFTTLALSLAVRDYPVPDILERQRRRILDPDRRRKLEFIMPALSSSEAVRDSFFHSLKEETTREKESWVLLALDYLHHPLRASSSLKYLRESLDLLEEIQVTGDIFFPQSWLQRTFGSYQSQEAAAVVRSFLKEHPDYNPKLKEKILQAADPLFRAEKLLYARQARAEMNHLGFHSHLGFPY